MSVVTIQIRKKGSLTLPMEIRRKYGFNEGDVFTLIDLGEGVFVLSSQVSTLDRLGDRVAEKLSEQGITVEEIYQVLDEEREQYYREHYVQTQTVPR